MSTIVNKATDYTKVAKVLKAAFLTQGLDRFQFLNYSQEFIEEFYVKRVKQFIDAEADILEINDYNAIAIWVPPNKVYPGAQWDQSNELVDEFKAKAVKVLEKYKVLQEPHWALSFIAKDPTENKGSIAPLIKQYLEKAKEQNLPATLFASNAHAKEVYSHYGFEVLESLKLAEGKANSKGERDPNGEGFEVYLMAYNYIYQV